VAWTELICFMIGTTGRLLWTKEWTWFLTLWEIF